MQARKAARGAAFLFLLVLFHAAHADPAAGKSKAAPCAACHGADGNSASAQFPVLAGQTARYLYPQLKDFKEGRRSEPTMAPIVAKLSTKDMLDLAEYFAAQKPKPIAFRPDAARVARQHPEYVIKQLKAFKARARTNDAGSMTSVAQTITEQDIEDLAHYISSLD